MANGLGFQKKEDNLFSPVRILFPYSSLLGENSFGANDKKSLI